mmetsp:Transcript_67065/g.132921  ORF Transcript_67065/g.132921 Transcript_67065/m.132921 type:complete len:135 (-) Transcript_67065:346-750(-)|eukprot:CAMPEP_0174743862 /NCGR_PEP_ID=MMETSP1094-20130205/82734_1 /TAXON_ID=156173 /ORGANISM="Chrysochromulina brevifilum, Strain UTEX LB 985" /LENGTH=134 /DNA_ID=CAMNT_0015948143 /DNA_START=313 /DNA_END=717 /DNA_ORIENTATION=-
MTLVPSDGERHTASSPAQKVPGPAYVISAREIFMSQCQRLHVSPTTSSSRKTNCRLPVHERRASSSSVASAATTLARSSGRTLSTCEIAARADAGAELHLGAKSLPYPVASSSEELALGTVEKSMMAHLSVVLS